MSLPAKRPNLGLCAASPRLHPSAVAPSDFRMTRASLTGSLLLALLLLPGSLRAASPFPELKEERPWAEWIERDFPFFSSIVDAREAGPASPRNNLTPRGLVLNLGHATWACFDPDLLRVSAIWMGEPVTLVGLAPISYHVPGQTNFVPKVMLPSPNGRVWLANGIYPGWQGGQTVVHRSSSARAESGGGGPWPLGADRRTIPAAARRRPADAARLHRFRHRGHRVDLVRVRAGSRAGEAPLSPGAVPSPSC